jgi:hypothetical protein
MSMYVSVEFKGVTVKAGNLSSVYRAWMPTLDSKGTVPSSGSLSLGLEEASEILTLLRRLPEGGDWDEIDRALRDSDYWSQIQITWA